VLDPLLDKVYYHCGVCTPAPAELAIKNYGHLLAVGANYCIDQPERDSY